MALSIRSVLLLDMTPGAAGPGNTDHTITRPFTVCDAWVIGTAVQAGGTIQASRQALGAGAFNTVTDAIACAAVDAKSAAAVITQAQVNFAVSDVLRCVVAGVATNGRMFLNCYPGVIASAS